MKFAPLLKDSTNSTGAGNITTIGAAVGYQSLAAIGPDGTTFDYMIRKEGSAEWEEGVGTRLSANTFSRAPTVSSNGGNLVNFSAGTKDVILGLTATRITAISPADIAFSTTVPLTNTAGSYMTGIQSVTGPLAFTPAAGAVRGAYTFAFLKADGANVPDVSAFTEHGSSAGYWNVAGYLNIGEFFYLAGTPWVSWSQAANPVAITTPTAVSLTGPTSGIINTASSNYSVNTDGVRSAAVVVTPTPVANVTFTPSSVTLPAGTSPATFTATSTTTGAKTIAVTNNGGLTNPSATTYTVSAAATVPGTMDAPVATAGIGNASLAFTAPIAGTTAIIGYLFTPYINGVAQAVQTTSTLTSPFLVTGLTAGTSYTFTGHAINSTGPGAESPQSNSVTPIAAQSARIGVLSKLIESGTGPYSYVGTSDASFGNADGGVSTTRRQPSVAGRFDYTIIGFDAANVVLQLSGLSTNGGARVGFGSLLVAVYTDETNSMYKPLSGGNAITPTTAIPVANGDVCRWSWTTSSVSFMVSKNNGATFTTLYAWPFDSTAFYIELMPNKAAGYGNISSVGLV